jgi:hypothetical protein
VNSMDLSVSTPERTFGDVREFSGTFKNVWKQERVLALGSVTHA